MSQWDTPGHAAPKKPAGNKGATVTPKRAILNAVKIGLQVLGWLFVAFSVFLIFSILMGLTSPLPLLVLQGMFPVVLLPLLAVWVVSTAVRKWALSATSLVVSLAFLLMALPAVTKDSTPKWTEDAAEFSLFVGNVSYRNPTPNSITKAVISSRADVVVLNEVSGSQFELLSEAGLFGVYTTVERVQQGSRYSELIMTSLPVVSSGIETVGNQRLPFVEITVKDEDRAQNDAGKNVKVYAVHAEAPSPSDQVPVWESDLEELADLSESDGPIVLAGDFNSTLWHKPLRDLLSTGFTDSHDFLGDGLSRSWGPNWARAAPFGAIMRLDHALTLGGVLPSSIGNREIQGSDHIAFRVDFAVDV